MWQIAAMKILVLHAHPRLSASVVQRAMLRAIEGLDDVTLVDLYAEYPGLDIDVAKEQQRLLHHDVIVLQHPFYWYSSPSIIKEWQDLVLENGWASGPGGPQLAGRFMMNAISTGGSEAAYHHEGRNRFEITELLSPFNQTAYLCSMAYLDPFVIHAGRRMAEADLSAAAESYRDLIVGLDMKDYEKSTHELNNALRQLQPLPPPDEATGATRMRKEFLPIERCSLKPPRAARFSQSDCIPDRSCHRRPTKPGWSATSTSQIGRAHV